MDGLSKRWDGDTRGRGVASGRQLLDAIAELREAIGLEGWVAEDAETHLRPQIVAAAAAGPIPLEIAAAEVDAGGVLVVRLHVPGEVRQREIRVAVWRLVAAVAEQSSFVRERRDGATTVFEVATGVLAGDTTFDTHGHVVRFVVEAALA